MIDVLSRLTAALSDRYRIERELGEGGMATVFLAHDLKHDRDVAIKLLRPELSQSITGERFLREIAITARLNHPHILALLDSGDAGGGEFVYYVMPLATGESLRDRLARDGALPIAEAVRLASEVTEALAHAHAQGIVHRDIKPANVLLSGGHAVVADFGIAKAVGQALDATTLTMDGVSLGTPVYMAPEQASGQEDIDHRADLYAVGAMIYEMCTGAPPFSGGLQQVLAEKLSKDAPSLATRCPTAPLALQQLVARCLARDAGKRPASAQALLAELQAIGAALSMPDVPATIRSRNRLLVVGGVVSIAVIGWLGFAYARDRRVRWLHETAIPTISRLIEADQLDSAFALASMTTERVSNDSLPQALWDEVSLVQEFLSEPSGAEVTRAPVNDTTRWTPIGTTPTPKVRIPNNAWYYRYTKPGYRTVTVMGAQLGGSYVPIPAPVALRRVTDPDSDMVQLRGGRLVGTMYGLSGAFELADFLMDTRETTNRQYKAFVNAGGYTNRAYWDSTIVRDGRPITWEAAMASFVDKTGRPGPSSWEGGSPPPDTDDLPVGGVSWYEARAYARWAGKELPTVYEWNAASMPEAARWVVPSGRYESSGPVRGGDARGVSARGVYDMAGNVREWAVNAREPGSRYILGGGWTDPVYLFSEIYSQPEFDRSPINGIRLVKRLGEGKELQAASAPIPGLTRDYNKVRPVDDATFRGLLAMYDYDHTPLNAKVDARDTTHADWIREDVSFDAPYGDGRMPAVLFLPKRVKAPYQTIVLWPASDAFFLKDRSALSMWFVDYLVRGGRAVLYPIYEHTYGRGEAMQGDVPSGSIAHRDQMLRWAKDMRRSIDYAVTRPDIDSTRLAYVGSSWGGRLGGVMMALEPRFRTGILNVAGLRMVEVRPEEDAVNFLPRIRIPVLMLSGKYDSVFPYELSQKPFYHLLGSPPADKKMVVFEGGHFLPRTELVAHSLTWLDKYLGPVQR